MFATLLATIEAHRRRSRRGFCTFAWWASSVMLATVSGLVPSAARAVDYNLFVVAG